MANIVVRYIGSSASGVLAAKEIAAANKESALTSTAAWDAFGKKTGGTFGNVASLSSKFAKLTSSPWVAAGVVAGVAIVAIGKASLDAASSFDVAHARLVAAAQAAGQSFTTVGGTVSAFDYRMQQLGFSAKDSEGSLARLTGATGNVGRATKLASEAADVARFKNEDLITATQQLTTIVSGGTRGFRTFGISLKYASGEVKSHTELMRELDDEIRGQAIAYTKTLAGQEDILRASLTNLATTIGHSVLPIVLTYEQTLGKLLSALHGVSSEVKLFEAQNKSAGQNILGTIFSMRGAIDVLTLGTYEFWLRGTKSTEKASGALKTNKDQVTDTSYAYLGLSTSVKTAAAAMDAISALAAKGVNLQIAVTGGQQSVQDALQALYHPDTGGGGGGGKTAAAAAIDQRQKELTLRDAMIGVKDAARGVHDAQDALTRAHKDQATAAHELGTAQQNLRTVLQGVASDSTAARIATDNLTSAQNAAAGSKLDVADAKRNLAKAKNDGRSSGFAIADAKQTLTSDLANGASQEQVIKDQVAYNDAVLDGANNNEAIRRAQLALSDAIVAAHGKTRALKTAQVDLNGTLHGFAKNSKEAKDAQDQLTGAEQNWKDAGRTVQDAMRQIITATGNVSDAQLALVKAQADISGALESSTTTAGNKVKALQTRVNDAATAVLGLATAFGQADFQITGSIGHMLQSQINYLKVESAANPLIAKLLSSAISSLEETLQAQQIHQGIYKNVSLSHSPNWSGKRAGGGPVSGGMPYMVGEMGRELFVPRTDGDIVPHGGSFRTGANVINITFTGPVMGADVERVVDQAAQNIIRKNGYWRGVTTR